MNPLTTYGINREVERGGIDVAIDTMSFRVRSASGANRGYRYALALAAGRRRDELKAGPAVAFDAHESIMVEAFADAVILGWSGVDGEDGNPLEFNRENCIKIFESCPDLFDQVRDAAMDTDRFRDVKGEDGEALGKP